MTVQRNRRPVRTTVSDNARVCREAQDEVSRFFQWTGASDSRMANAWRQRATDMILAGSTVQEAVGTVKDEWYARCRKERTKPQADRATPELAARLQEVIAEAHRGATPQVAALMYRHIAHDFPTESSWLVRWASLWESWVVWQPISGWES